MPEAAHPPATREIQADTEISTALNGIAVQMAGLRHDGLSQEQCRDLYARMMVEMVNAAGIDMHGRTLFNPAANASESVNLIAHQLGTAPTGYRTKVFVSPYERLSAGASALIVQQDGNGEDHVLLVKSAKRPDQWTLPAGYMDPLPASHFTAPDRVSREMRSAQEEAQVAGKRLYLEIPKAPPDAGLPVTELPSGEDSTRSFVNDYRRLLKEQGWQSAQAHMNDSDYLRCIMGRDGHPVPVQPGSGTNYDLNAVDNIRREAKEETGLNIEALERAGQAKITLVSTEVGLAAGGGKRPNFATPHFLIDLGRADALPALKPEDHEISEAVWVPLSAITRDAETGNYMVKRENQSMPLDVFSIPDVERSLNRLLSERMKEASGGRVESIGGLKAQATSWQSRTALQHDTLASVALESVAALPDRALPSLIDVKGQALLHALPRAAVVIAQAQDAPARQGEGLPTAWVDRISEAIVQQAAQSPRNP